jgi:hypothetical protein
MKTTTQSIYVGRSQVIEGQGCYAISFFRPTTSNPVRVNGVPLEAGQTMSISQNVGDADHSAYEIVFSSGPATNEMYVSRIMPLI